MGFFDTKLILIFVLTLALFFLFKEVYQLKKTVNLFINSYHQLNNLPNNQINNPINAQLNNPVNDQMNNPINDQMNNSVNNQMNGQLNTPMNNPVNDLSINIPFFGNIPFPMALNPLNEYLETNIRTITVPINGPSDLINTPSDLINGPTDLVGGMMDILITTNDPLVDVTNNDRVVELSSESNYDDVRFDQDETENNIKAESVEETEINTQNSSHIEVYSNKGTSEISTHINEPEETNKLNETTNINESNDYESVLKNINKYKLPELQDIAIEYKLDINKNNKKKTKNELIDDIKNYISNKNI